LTIPELEKRTTVAGEHPSVWKSLRQKHVLAFLAACFLMQASHGAYYTFYSIFLDGYGYSKAAIGELWAFSVGAEVVLYVFFMHRLLDAFGARALLLLSLLLAAIRWILIALFPDSVVMLVLAQLLHAATFGSFHAAAIHLVFLYFPGRLQGRGQALYSSLSYGAGGAIGSVAAGFTWDNVGAHLTFIISALLALTALVIAFVFLREPGRGRSGVR
jgi:PPP family 3-phenylpropionic acid transporter